jgi:hypothetical protein
MHIGDVWILATPFDITHIFLITFFIFQKKMMDLKFSKTRLQPYYGARGKPPRAMDGY